MFVLIGLGAPISVLPAPMSRRWWQQADEDVSAGGDDDAPPWSDDDSHWGHIEHVNVNGPKGETLKEFPQPTMKPIPCWPLPTPRAGGGASGGAARTAAAPPAGRADAPTPRTHPSNSASRSATYPSANRNP